MTQPKKGQIFGECGTPDCTNKARWVSIHEVKKWPDVVYRCPDCCDRIDEALATARVGDDARFCPRCDIDLGLHGTNDPDDADCRIAASKADLVASFDRIFGLGAYL